MIAFPLIDNLFHDSEHLPNLKSPLRLYNYFAAFISPIAEPLKYIPGRLQIELIPGDYVDMIRPGKQQSCSMLAFWDQGLLRCIEEGQDFQPWDISHTLRAGLYPSWRGTKLVKHSKGIYIPYFEKTL
jgi:hypothetical protein